MGSAADAGGIRGAEIVAGAAVVHVNVAGSGVLDAEQRVGVTAIAVERAGGRADLESVEGVARADVAPHRQPRPLDDEPGTAVVVGPVQFGGVVRAGEGDPLAAVPRGDIA